MGTEQDKKRKKPYDYKLGEIDNDGAIIRKIYASSPDYVVYRTDNSIRIDIDDDCSKCGEYSDRHYKLGVDLARIYSWLPENLSSYEPVNKQIARAVSTNAAGNYEQAKAMLDHAEKRVISLKTIDGRLDYTLSAMVLVT